MKIYEEKSLVDFKFWSGAKDRASQLTISEFETIESELEQLYPDGMNETEINDLFWFDFEWIVQLLGYENEEDFEKSREN